MLHELAHILCGHQGERYRHDEPALSALDGAPDGGAVVRFRSVHDSAAEREAELLAAAFVEYAIDDGASPGPAGPWTRAGRARRAQVP
ncbi:hypothetical protein AB0N09_13805 [Streptomyces erythrochromogenes]|uniref:hypothetical protein n=1 Tax=Streptomyces erythrochromogenes TaxID=285574 RepID=UPI003414E349